MKLLYLLLLLLPLPFVFTIDTDPIDKTAELIRQGNVPELAKSFSSTIELIIMGEENSNSNTQAETALSDFFSQHQPQSVKILHRIASNPNIRFAVIILTTNNGVFRTSFSLKNAKDHFELTELRIEAQKTK